MGKKNAEMESLKKSDFSSTKIADNLVVDRVLKGEKELFEILMRRYNQTLYRAVRSYLKIEDDIEDTMQETYIKAFKKLYQFKGEASFATWLIRIGINEALQHIRKHKRNQPINIGRKKAIPLSGTHNMNPEEKAIQHETSILIEKAIDQLPEKYRVVYILREVEGMKNRAISDGLGISENNVKVRFHRSKALLKEILYEFTNDVELFEFGDSKCDKLVDNVMQKV